MARVIVVGSINVDHIIRCAALPLPGETVLASSQASGFGGKGGNQAAAAARLGAATWLVAAVGTDTDGDLALADLAGNGVHTQHIKRDPDEPTGVATVLVADDGENAILVLPGANVALSPSDVENALGSLQLTSADIVLVNAEVAENCAEAAAVVCAAAGARLVYNLAPARPLSAWVRRHRPLLVVNEIEAMQAGGQRSLSDAVDALVASLQTLVVTLGSRGALLADGDIRLEMKALSVTPVDSTGAGDAFCGALVADLADGRSLRESMATAIAAGTFAVGGAGARGALASRSDLPQM